MLRGGLLFEITFETQEGGFFSRLLLKLKRGASFRDGSLLQVKPTRLLFEVLRYFSCYLPMKTRKEKRRSGYILAVRTEQTRLITCLLYGFVDYSGLAGVLELEICTATYRPEIDDSEHAKSVTKYIKLS